ncbi:MAG: TonB-dependent receptor, partial [Balneolaceae bacterium]
TISADMVQDLEVIKVITPDMEADALSGVININTRRPVGGEKDLNIRLGGGAQDRYLRHSGTNQRASISYGDSPDDTYSFGVNFSYQRDPNAREIFRTDWDNGNFGEGPVDILSDIGTELSFDAPERIGTGLQFTFQPTNISTYHIQGMFNVQNRERRVYAMSYNPRMENYTGQTQTGYPDGGGGPNAANQSTIAYNPRLDESTTHQYTIQAGARHRLEKLDVEYSLGWGHGRFNDDQYRMEFETFSRHEFIFDLEDRWNPTVEVAPWSEIPNFPQPNQMIFQSMDHRINSNMDNDLQGKIDFEVPYSLGEIKFGSSASLTYKQGVGERLDREYSSRLDVSTFQLIENGTWQIFDRDHSTYQVPWLVDMQKAKDFYITQTPRFTTDLEEWALSTETSRYYANENTFASYAMAELEVAWFKLLGGLRMEHTSNSYSGREAEISDSGIFRGANDIESQNGYTNFFPNLQLVFGLSQLTNIRLAYSRSIGRPSFNQLNPYVMRNYNNQTIQQGNPNLDPMLSNNYDFMFEHYFMNVGQLTFGLFYKDMEDFVFSYSERITGDESEDDAEFVGWRRSGYRNGDRATVYGVEFTWQQNLEFLPGFLSNLGTYFNYSYAQSIADLGRGRERTEHGLAKLLEALGRDVSEDYKYVTPLSGQRPHVINAGLDYQQGDFSSQISYQWAAPSISSYGSNDRQWIALTNQPVYFDQYNDAAQELSFTARYWLSSNFQVWIDISNILNQTEVNYYYDREYYPSTTRLRGRELSAGIRYRL